jgi:hypothetical protein
MAWRTRKPTAGALVVGRYVARPVGRMTCSARSRSVRAISMGSPVSTSFDASTSTSCCADRISPPR